MQDIIGTTDIRTLRHGMPLSASVSCSCVDTDGTRSSEYDSCVQTIALLTHLVLHPFTQSHASTI